MLCSILPFHRTTILLSAPFFFFTLEITVVTIRFYCSRCCFVVGLFADCHLECHARPYPSCSIAAKSHVTGLKILICVEWADFS